MKIKNPIIDNSFVDEKNVWHVQWHEKGGLFYNQEKIELEGEWNR